MPKGDTYSRGDGSLARGVRKKRQRTCAVETGPKSCFVRIHRQRGDELGAGDISLLNSDSRFVLGILKAVFVRSEPGEGKIRWVETYRIPIPEGQTLQDINRILRSRDLPCADWGTGHVSIQGTGQTGAEAVGRMKARQQSAQRARVETRLRCQMLPIELLARLGTCEFQDGKAVYTPLRMSDVEDVRCYDDGKPMPYTAWAREAKDWFSLCEKWAGFAQIYTHVADEKLLADMAGANGLHPAVQALRVLDRWVEDQFREELPSTGFVAVDSKKPARGY